MLLPRIIPCLLLHNESLIKSKKFKNFSYVGDPINTVRIFNRLEVDELIFLDILASKNKYEPPYHLIKNIADECFMPFTYGGGVSSLEVANKIFDCGVEKIAMNSSVINNPKLITEIANKFGSQSVVVSIDIKYDFFGKKRIFNHSIRKYTSLEPLNWGKSVEELGAGEILLTCVNNEGVWNGLDIKLIKYFTSSLNIPIVAHGGALSLENISRAIKDGGASGVAVGSMFVYQKKGMGVLINYPSEAELKKVITIDKRKKNM
ncbi:MAG: Imidazole glycerol phosphate synthase subunit HisF [Alphaproteobacteria bacterium MarineAlpha2_Bin1]|nr:MAG: Imidazole glycerol phosphate synthase subunit HisF [Alphaproteobacteria bacterium MarineAlpha2_Bin1]